MSRMTLVDARRLIGWSQRRLAREAGETPTNIADIETGRNARPAYALVMNIVNALRRGGLQGIQPEDIFPTDNRAEVA
jgi:transcriptional regulator with XRE-family HTH domain